MMHLSSLLLTTGLAPLGLAAYSIKDDYSAHNFFNMFTFDTVRSSPRTKLVDI